MKEIMADIKQSMLYQHKSLVKALDSCKMSQEDKRFILVQNRINTKTSLIHLKRLEDRFIFKKPK